MTTAEHGTSPSATTNAAAPKPRRRVGKRTWLVGGVVAGVIVLGGAGFAIADEVADGSDALDDATRDRVATAAIAAAGGGELVDAERDDDGGYDAEVRLSDGAEVDVTLDDEFAVVSSDVDGTGTPDADDSDGDDANGQGSGTSGDTTAGAEGDARDDAPLTPAETTSATEAALAETGSGEVVDVDRSDDAGHAFEVEVRLADGREIEVRLDADFGVVSSSPSD
jgi:uncharacterized membrane protein YkoI